MAHSKSFKLKAFLNIPKVIAHYSNQISQNPKNMNADNSNDNEVYDQLILVSEQLWSYYSQLDAELDLAKKPFNVLSFESPTKASNIENTLLKNMEKLPPMYAQEIIKQHKRFKCIFIKRSLRERDFPGQLNEITMQNLPLLNLFHGSKGDLLAMPALVALRNSKLNLNTTTFCSRYLRYFVRTRAIIDDIKDWKEDLSNGQLTCIHAMCLRSLLDEMPERTLVHNFSMEQNSTEINFTINHKITPRIIVQLLNTHHTYIHELSNSSKYDNEDIKRILKILEPAIDYMKNLEAQFAKYYSYQLPTAVPIEKLKRFCYSR